jgi:hypothetical protein
MILDAEELRRKLSSLEQSSRSEAKAARHAAKVHKRAVVALQAAHETQLEAQIKRLTDEHDNQLRDIEASLALRVQEAHDQSAAELAQVRTELASQRAEVATLQGDNDALLRQLEQSAAQVANLNEQIVALQAQLAVLRQAYHESDGGGAQALSPSSTLASLRVQTADLRQENDVLLETVADLEEKLNGAEQRLAAATAAAPVSVDAVANGGGDPARAEARFELERAEFTRQSGVLSSRLELASAEAAQLRAQLASLQASYAELESDNRELVALMEGDKEDEAAATDVLAAQQDKRALAKAEQKLAQQTAANNDLLSQMSALRSAHSALQGTQVRAAHELDSQRAASAKLHERYDALAREKEALKKQVSSMQQQLALAANVPPSNGPGLPAHPRTPASSYPAPPAASPATTPGALLTALPSGGSSSAFSPPRVGHSASASSGSGIGGHSPSPSQLLGNRSALELKLSSLLHAYEELIEKERIRVPPIPADEATAAAAQAAGLIVGVHSSSMPPSEVPTPQRTPPIPTAGPASAVSSASGSTSATLLAALPTSRVRGTHARSLSVAAGSSAGAGGGTWRAGADGSTGSSKVDAQWRRLSRLNSLLVSAKAKLSDAASFEELQKHAAELEKEGLVLDEEDTEQ